MPTESGKPLIVISYAHADEPEHPAEGEVKWLSFVIGYLRPAIKHGAVDLWLDRLMPGGADWQREIAQKLGACDVFILLVSRHSLSSDYVVDKEIAIIRERQAQGEAVHFYPLILTPTPKIALDLVHDRNLRPRDGKPFSDYSVNERYRHMSEAADEIAEIAKKIETNASLSLIIQPQASSPSTGPIRSALQRDFTDRSIEDVLLLYRGAPNGLQADRLIEPFKGLWIAVEGSVTMLLRDGAGGAICALTRGAPRELYVAECRFSSDWETELFHIKNGEIIRVAGKIAPHQNGSQLYLLECELLRNDSERGTAGLSPRIPAGEELGVVAPHITDQDSLEAWLKGQSREVSVAIAVRAALRVLPFAVRVAPKRPNEKTARQFAALTSTMFRANAVARAAGKYPAGAIELRASVAADAADAAAAAYAAGAAGRATTAATAYAADAAAYAARAAAGVDAAARAAAYATRAVAAYAAYAVPWEGIRADIAALQTHGESALANLPLWSDGGPAWANAEWTSLKTALPRGEDWEVWIDWYEDRLRGGSRGEDYELVFASVPQDEWDKGPAAANAWIKAHLASLRLELEREVDRLEAELEALRASPHGGIAERQRIAHLAREIERLKRQLREMAETARPDDFPEPVANVELPWTYARTAKGTVTTTAGAEAFPFYPYFNSEEEHRETLDLCRIGAERLLKKLLAGRYHNVRPEYAERLVDYLDDLPKTADGGSILLAYDDILNLRSDFEADVECLPAPFATDLKRVIENQFALNSFYDIVERHNEAIATATRSRPFPKDAIRPLRQFISENTPQYFEPNVSEAQRRLDRTEPRESSQAPEDSKAAERASAAELPTPPGTPDVKRAHERQTAANANAIWEVVVKGPAAIEGWWQLAHQLGDLVRPFLDYLR